MSGPAGAAGADPSPPLWQLLQAAAGVVGGVLAGSSATALIEATPAGQRPATQALAFHALRQLGRAQALRRRLAPRAPPPAADALLCTAIALAWDEAVAPYPPFTLVDQAVEAAKRQAACRAQAAFINACLRRLLRDRAALVAATDAEPLARWNHPAWWIARLRRDWPEHWARILEASNRPPPLTLRVNARKGTPEQTQIAWAAMEIRAYPTGAHGLVLAAPRPLAALPGFAQGQVSVQDAAAQLAAPLLLDGLAPPAGRRLRVLDACAAPGGKTAHLLELADAEVTALEIDATRAARIDQTLGRLGLAAPVRVADAARPQDWWDGRPFDAILLDAPCTASGIVRRHPDVRWLRRESDIARLADLQRQLLAALWPLLAPGGRLLYCTCSVFKAEGQEQISAFVAHNTQARLRVSPGHLLPQFRAGTEALRDNGLRDHDGFFYALLERALS